jgi:hypothetical protein
VQRHGKRVDLVVRQSQVNFSTEHVEWKLFVMQANKVRKYREFEYVLKWFMEKIVEVRRHPNARYQNVFDFSILVQQVFEHFFKMGKMDAF